MPMYTPMSAQQKPTPNLSARMSESLDAEPDSPASKKQEPSDGDEVLLNALDFQTAPVKLNHC